MDSFFIFLNYYFFQFRQPNVVVHIGIQSFCTDQKIPETQKHTQKLHLIGGNKITQTNGHALHTRTNALRLVFTFNHYLI